MLNIESDLGGNVDIRVYDLYGKLVHSARVQALSGINTFQLDLSHLNQAIYLIQAQNNHGLTGSKRIAISK
jgi:hypothetical protein